MTEQHSWQTLTNRVLDDGIIESPRGRKTLAIYDITYSMDPDEHFDSRQVRNVSLNYVFREFLWFCRADRFDIRMANYAPIWKTCIRNGGINSNYGQYLFKNGFESNFCLGLRILAGDEMTRRCWLPIFQQWHHDVEGHQDYPCTTGIGFSIRADNTLCMKVHMRSQDLWWGAANDEPVCYLIQLMAQTYLRMLGTFVDIGPIIHHIDNLHLYDRHWEIANAAAIDYSQRDDVQEIRELCRVGFETSDLEYLLNQTNWFLPSPLLSRILDIPGAYGMYDEEAV